MARELLLDKNFFFHSKYQKQAPCIERKKLLLASSYPGKLNQSDKHFVRLLLLKGVYDSCESFFDIYLFELNNLETL